VVNYIFYIMSYLNMQLWNTLLLPRMLIIAFFQLSISLFYSHYPSVANYFI